MVRPLWTSPRISNAQSTQTLKFTYGRYLGNYWKHKILNTNNSRRCTRCRLDQNDTCLHLLSCCTNKHINDLLTNWHDNAFHAIVDKLSAPPHTRHFTPLHAGTQHQWQPQNTLPTWSLPSYCFLFKCKCLAKLRHDTLCIKGKSPTYSTPFIPTGSITIQFIKFTSL